MNIVLASSSPYRKQMLEKLLPSFKTCSPEINEMRLSGEPFEKLAGRLAQEKSVTVAEKHPNALIIGSDQVASIGNIQLSKPGNEETCFQQLKACQGKTVQFHTGICLFNSKTNKFQSSVENYQTTFRSLSDQQVRNYIKREPAFDCAGGFKMEGLGISLFEKIRGDDPNILVGLPLIRLIDMLSNEGVNIL